MTELRRLNFNDTNLDAFGRLRVSNPVTTFDSKQLFDKAPLFWDDQETSGSGTTSTYNTDQASTTIAVGATTAGTRIRQTFMRFNYQPGKSQLVFLTGTLDLSGGGTGITCSMGLNDADNGICAQCKDGVINMVLRSNTTGSPVDTTIAQSSWNLDKLDGTGASGKTLDASKSQILIIDFEWLGVGRVRTGWVIGGAIIYCHQFLHSNISAGVYMSVPNLPLRYEISNDGTGTASSLEHICGTVISEGGLVDNGVLRYESTSGTHINANTADTIYAIGALRLKSAYIGTSIKIKSITVVNATADDFEWMLIINPTVGTGVSFADVTNSAIQYATGNAGSPSTSTLTGGTKLVGGMVKASGSTGDVTVGIDNALLVGSEIDGTVQEIYLGVRPLSSNADIEGGITWRELS